MFSQAIPLFPREVTEELTSPFAAGTGSAVLATEKRGKALYPERGKGKSGAIERKRRTAIVEASLEN